jgi:hypothetical protein
MNNNKYIYTNNDTNMILQTEKIDDNAINLSQPRYGTSVDLKSNKIINQSDKYTSRNKLLSNISKYKISRLAIDTRYRDINPRNIINQYIKLNNNPFTFLKYSNILKIAIPKGNNLNIDDYITISNIKPQQITFGPNKLIIEKDSNLITILHDNHPFIGTNDYIIISDVISSDGNNFFGNIPVAIINGTHNIILKINNNIIDPNAYYIRLNIISENYYNYNDTFTINIITMNGINIKYIAANYPISNDVLQGYHTISDIITENSYDFIKIQLQETATSSSSDLDYRGNDNILIGIISSLIDGYPEPGSYIYKFKKPFTKLRKIKLVSTEFPNSQLLINNTINKNDMFYWQILDDGNYIYKINITPGNYDATSLQKEMITKISLIPRIFPSYLNNIVNNYYNYCIPDIIINPYNNIFSISILGKIFLSKNIYVDINKTYDDGFIRINIYHPYHNIEIGDKIIITNAINVPHILGNNTYIPNEIINSEQIIESIDNINNYTIKLKRYNYIIQNDINESMKYGGNAVEITYPLGIRLLFNYNDTFGKVLGFSKVGDSISITNYQKIITNRDLYNNSSNLNSVGLIDYTTPLLDFTTYPYILMASDMFSSNINGFKRRND